LFLRRRRSSGESLDGGRCELVEIAAEQLGQLCHALLQLRDLLLQRSQPGDLCFKLGDPRVAPVLGHHHPIADPPRDGKPLEVMERIRSLAARALRAPLSRGDRGLNGYCRSRLY
jgi:hypothetical protein